MPLLNAETVQNKVATVLRYSGRHNFSFLYSLLLNATAKRIYLHLPKLS